MPMVRSSNSVIDEYRMVSRGTSYTATEDCLYEATVVLAGLWGDGGDGGRNTTWGLFIDGTQVDSFYVAFSNGVWNYNRDGQSYSFTGAFAGKTMTGLLRAGQTITLRNTASNGWANGKQYAVIYTTAPQIS